MSPAPIDRTKYEQDLRTELNAVRKITAILDGVDDPETIRRIIDNLGTEYARTATASIEDTAVGQ